MSALVNRALIFANHHHRAVGQVRKYTGEPYIVHPCAVALIVAGTPGATEEMIAASWLHDVVEDTEATLDVVRYEFSEVVASYVEMLTDVSKPTDGNRAARKAIDREHTAKVCPEAKTIKLADLIDNTTTIVKHDPEFAKVYLAEKRLLLDVLREGDAGLWERALALYEACEVVI